MWAWVFVSLVWDEMVRDLENWSTSFGRNRGWISGSSPIVSQTVAAFFEMGEVSTFRFPLLLLPYFWSQEDRKVSTVVRQIERSGTLKRAFPKFPG
jgi:hypothetical protein